MSMRKLTRTGSILLMSVFIAFALALGACTGAAKSDVSSQASSQAGSSVTAVAMDSAASASKASAAAQAESLTVSEDGEYSDKEHVALYIHTYGHLPSNYISKTKARKKGWDSSKGNLWDVLPGMSIGGSEFYNDDGQLPDEKGRRWTECDIDYEGGYRNAKRIVFSNDGLIFYTDDHYDTFEQLY